MWHGRRRSRLDRWTRQARAAATFVQGCPQSVGELHLPPARRGRFLGGPAPRSWRPETARRRGATSSAVRREGSLRLCRVADRRGPGAPNRAIVSDRGGRIGVVLHGLRCVHRRNNLKGMQGTDSQRSGCLVHHGISTHDPNGQTSTACLGAPRTDTSVGRAERPPHRHCVAGCGGITRCPDS